VDGSVFTLGAGTAHRSVHGVIHSGREAAAEIGQPVLDTHIIHKISTGFQQEDILRIIKDLEKI
jgi:hypothetical protein